MNKVVFLIPYFGRIPDYFHLWLRSAEANPQFTFFLYTDLPFPVSSNSNVQIKRISFAQLQDKVRWKLGKSCVLKDPYKLCDYKPAYGELFAEDIQDFDFWGFCDVDLILGHLQHFISEELLATSDKLFDLGHFCIMRNNNKMNSLYKLKYPNVLDFAYTSRTNYCCHFDENGAIAYAPNYDTSIRFYTAWPFFDVPINQYKMLHDGVEVYAVWENGVLTLNSIDGGFTKEIMYIHLQKRKMTGIESVDDDAIVVARDAFYSKQDIEYLKTEQINPDKEQSFFDTSKERRKKEIVRNFMNGALCFRFYRLVYGWKQR